MGLMDFARTHTIEDCRHCGNSTLFSVTYGDKSIEDCLDGLDPRTCLLFLYHLTKDQKKKEPDNQNSVTG